jgi:hypothetical protein
MMNPIITTGITSDNVARVMFEYLRETEGIEVDDVEQLAELLVRDTTELITIDTKARWHSRCLSPFHPRLAVEAALRTTSTESLLQAIR